MKRGCWKLKEKKYRIWMILLIVFVLAGGTILYFWNGKKNDQKTDGIFVQNMISEEMVIGEIE